MYGDDATTDDRPMQTMQKIPSKPFIVQEMDTLDGNINALQEEVSMLADRIRSILGPENEEGTMDMDRDDRSGFSDLGNEINRQSRRLALLAGDLNRLIRRIQL